MSLSSEPQPPERFTLTLRVVPGDIDELGHVNNVVYLRWVQDIAVAHWRTAATPAQQESLVWVAVRHEIDYKRAAMPDEEILLVTWVGVATRRTFERHTEVLRASDRTLLARARTIWCPLDRTSLKVVEVGPDIRERFSVPGP